MRTALALSVAALAAGCGAHESHYGTHHGSRCTEVALASPENSPKWVRLDTVTGDMLVCRELPQPTTSVLEVTFSCAAVNTGTFPVKPENTEK
jgi:hypothetical protein